MKAMVLAAGVGSRLRPLTERTPKALIEVGGATMLERTLRRLKAAGVTEAIVNVHHRAEAVAAYVRSRDFGLRIEISREDDLLLDTGGGLKNASWFFDDGRAFLVHNVDVLTDLDLRELLRAHAERPALATLSARERAASRYLLFDSEGLLCGREGRKGERTLARRSEPALRLGFDGVQAVSPELLGELKEEGPFSLTEAYLRLAASGRSFRAFRPEGGYWADIGTPEKLERARRLAAERGLPS